MTETQAKGARWLMDQQADDGGWHSETYGALREGAATTALALYAMSRTPGELRDEYRKPLQRGYHFLARGIARKGYVTSPAGADDYPTYGSAMTWLAVQRMKLKADEADQNKLIDFILREQLTEAKDFSPESVEYGGWDFMGGAGLRGETSGTNVSVTSIAVEALAACDDRRAPAALEKAQKWAAGCQNLSGDGGFFFHPQARHLGNKAEWQDDKRARPRSYGTATADGLRCLLLSGAKLKSKPVVAAVAWLRDHSELKSVPGFEDAPENLGWNEGLLYYYYFSLAKAMRLLPADEFKQRRTDMHKIIAAKQKPDGRWQNKSARMREDDPLIATCFAIVGLGDERAN